MSDEFRDLFVESAITSYRAVQAGVPRARIAEAIGQEVRAKPQLRGDLAYTSGAAVGYHVATGEVLLLPGRLPRTVHPRDIQMLIKQAGMLATHHAIDLADTQENAHARLVAAVAERQRKKLSAPQPQATNQNDDKVVELFELAMRLIEVASRIDFWDQRAKTLASRVVQYTDGQIRERSGK